MPGMSDQPIQFSAGGLPETVLPQAPAEAGSSGAQQSLSNLLKQFRA